MQLTPTQASLIEWRLRHMARATVLARPAADLRRVAGDLEKAEGKGVYKFIRFLCIPFCKLAPQHAAVG